VSKKTRKATRKSIGGAAARETLGTCARCSRALRLGDKKCKCGKANPYHTTGKSVRPGVFKAAGGRLVDIRWPCAGGHANGPDRRKCAECGLPRNISPAAHATWMQKSARPGGTTMLGEEFARTDDPGRREELYPAIVKAAGGRDAAVLDALGGWGSVRWLAVNSPDPGQRESCQNLIDHGTYGTDGAA
jgi:hypothetical protein